MIAAVRAALAMPLVMLALFLAGCAGGPAPEQRVEIREVRVPYAVNCLPDLGAEPAYPDTDQALAGVASAFDGVKFLKAGRLLRDARLAEYQAARKACEALPRTPP